MRKLVLGILALVSVQFAFVTYMMIQQSPMELASAPVQTERWRTNRGLVQIDELNNAAEVVREPEAVVSPTGPRQTTARPLAANVPERVGKLDRPEVSFVSKPAFDLAPSKAAPSGEFASVVILYDRGPNIPDYETRETSKSKKRSFIAKAFPVIKKPWEWIKSVGSKLN